MKRILTAAFKHETNSYCPEPADLKAFKEANYREGAEILQVFDGVKNEFGGFIDVFKKYPDYELVPSIYFTACPSAPVTADVYDYALSKVTQVYQEQGPFEGILLCLHGAMVAEGHPDAEGDFVSSIRELAGSDIPIVVTLDLHANVTPKLARVATALVPYENYPHTDQYETGLYAATILAGKLTKKMDPQFGYHYIPYLLPLFPSEFPEIKHFHDLAREYEKIAGVYKVRICHGFFPADINEMGMSVEVVTDGDKELAQKIADELGNVIWNERNTLKRKYISLDEALDIVEQNDEGCIVLADASDNPGAGGMGETTWILRRILERGITGGTVASIYDPKSVEDCVAAGVCNTVKLTLGGLYDHAVSGEPIEAEGVVEHLCDGNYICHGPMGKGAPVKMGKSAVVNIGGNHVIINSIRVQPLDLQFIRCCGLAPEDQTFIVVKSSVHYRAHYQTIAKQMIDLAVPGYSVPVPDGYEYKFWKTPDEKK